MAQKCGRSTGAYFPAIWLANGRTKCGPAKSSSAGNNKKHRLKPLKTLTFCCKRQAFMIY